MLPLPPSWFWILVATAFAWPVAREYRSLPKAIHFANQKLSLKKGGLVTLLPRRLTVVYGIFAIFFLSVGLLLSLDSLLFGPEPDQVDFSDSAFPFKINAASFTEDDYSVEVPLDSSHYAAPEQDFERIENATLGFQKVYVVNLPERTDKRDALSLIGALTNVKLDWVKAIRGSDVPDKALPLGVHRNGWRDGGIGSWRSQMNVIRTQVSPLVSQFRPYY